MNMSNQSDKDMKISLNFSVDSFDFEDVKDMRFMKGTIHAFADGPNAHTHPIETKVLIDCANSVYDIPIVCRYNGFTDDFMSHEADETPIGFVKETSPTYSNPIIFEKNTDGRTFIVIKALIWKKYAEDAVRVLKNSNGKKSVSVEITVTKGEDIDGKLKVDEFVLDGITILGDFVQPAVKDARIQVEFAKDKKEFLDNLKFSESKTEMGDNMNNEVNMSDVSPCGENMKCAEQSCSETSFAKTNCSELSTSNNAKCAAETKCAKSEKCEEQMKCSENAECAKTTSCAATPCSENAACGSENMKCAEPSTDIQERGPHGEHRIDKNMNPNEKEDMPDASHCAEAKCACGSVSESKDIGCAGEMKQDGSCKMSIEQAMAEIEKMSAKIDQLEAQNKAYMSELEIKKDYDDLKAFKERTEARIKQEEDMRLINDVLTEIRNRGYNMSDEEKEQLKMKFSEFDSADAWANYAKAQAFENGNKSESDVQKIGLPYANTKPTQSIWDII